MRDWIELGSTPHGEDCVGVGDDNYRERVHEDCTRFRDQLIRKFGNSQRFGIKGFPHDFGTYYEVVVYFDPDDEEDFAFFVDANLPEFWDKVPACQSVEKEVADELGVDISEILEY